MNLFLHINKKIIVICLVTLLILSIILAFIWSDFGDISLKERLNEVQLREITIDLMTEDSKVSFYQNFDKIIDKITAQVDLLEIDWTIDLASKGLPPVYPKGVLMLIFNGDKSFSILVNEKGDVTLDEYGKKRKVYNMKKVNDTYFDELLKLLDAGN